METGTLDYFYVEYSWAPVLAEASVSLSLGRVLDVGVVQEVLARYHMQVSEKFWMLPTNGSKIYLDAEENLLDSDGRAPVLLLIQDGEAHLSRGKLV